MKLLSLATTAAIFFCCAGCSTTAGMGVGSASGSGLAIALGVGIAAVAIVRGKKK
jgi:hypothetical protein